MRILLLLSKRSRLPALLIKVERDRIQGELLVLRQCASPPRQIYGSLQMAYQF